jgi:hypothetical protein
MIDPNDPGTMDLVAACEEPLSGAERARRHRLKKKQAGVKPISLTSLERCVLSLGLLAHEDLDHRQANWETTKKPGFDALLKKLWPEGDNGRYLAEPKRSTYRPAAFLRDQLEQAKTENQRLKSALHEIAAEMGAVASVPAKGVQGQESGDFATLEVTDASLLPVWETLPSDFARAATALGLLRLRNAQHAELVCAVEVLQARLGVAGLSERVSDNKQEWYWNPIPHRDYRATSAPEYMERLSAAPSMADDRASLHKQIETLEKEQALLEAERNKAFAANRTLTERLRRAGLPTDYRAQPGE